MHSTRNHFKYIYKLKVKDVTNTKHKKAGVGFMNNEVNLKTRSIIRGKKGHFITMKGLIPQEAITRINV